MAKRLVLVFAAFTVLFNIAHAQTDSEEGLVRQNLTKILPAQVEIESVELTSMEGVYEVQAGPQIMYVYSVGDFIMVGEVYDTDQHVSWSQLRKDKEREVALKELDAMSEENMIIMGDLEGERYVTVFTDTDCGWCQKFHKDIPELTKGGLKVRYLMWPRAGLNSESYREAVSVWCAEDQGAAMTIAKNRQRVEPKDCDNPVEEQYNLGFRLGVQGTPFVMMDNGKVMGGYVPPQELLSEAGLN